MLRFRAAIVAGAAMCALAMAICASGVALAAGISCERVLTVLTDTSPDPVTVPLTGTVCDPAAIPSSTVTMSTSTGSGTATATVSDSSASYGFSSGRARPVTDFPAPPLGVTFPHGVFELNLDGCPAAQTTQIALTLPAALPPGTSFYVFGGTAEQPTPHWFTIDAAIAGSIVRIAVSDGGYGDGDLSVNSRITVVGGPAIGALPQSVPIPSLGRPLLLLLIGCMCGLAWALRSKLSIPPGIQRALVFAAVIAGTWGAGDLLVSAVAQGSPPQPVQLVPPTLSFPARMPGQTTPSQAVTATNVSGAALHIREIIAPDNFQQENNCGDLAINQSCNISVKFAPVTTTSCAPLPPPILTSLDPGAIVTGTMSAPLALTGSGFQRGAVVAIDALRQGTNSVTPTAIALVVPDSVTAVSSTPAVKVINPDGGVSNSLPLRIVSVNPPTVTLTMPLDGAHFLAPATVSLSATAAAPGSAISHVDFFADGVLLSSVAALPYQYGWSNVPAAHYTLTARATAVNGATATSSPVSITVDPPPNQPPTVSITAPTSGQTFTFGASIAIAASAGDVDGRVVRVEFFGDGTLLGQSLAEPYTVTWSSAPVGLRTLTAKATDDKGATATSLPISITVIQPTNQPPTVALTAPTAGQNFPYGTAITVSATASDADGSVAKVDFYEGSALLATATSQPWSFAWNGASIGPHTLTAKATDNQGAAATSSPVSITVSPPEGPTVVLLAPVNHSVYAGPATILLAASAQSPNATIRNVEFFSNGHSVGSIATAPYNLILTNVAIGSYAITATATDSAARQATSSPSNISVRDFGDDPDIVITSHADGQIVNADFITLFGVTKNIVQVTIPGFCDPIQFANNAFRATPLPLAYGDNEIIVEGLSNHGVTLTRVITLKNTLPKLAITSPAPNENTDQSDIMVEGTFVAPPASIVALTKSIGLQGSLGTLNSGTGFNAKVPLHLGANTIIATLTTPDRQTVVKSLNVTRVNPSGLAIRITSPADQAVFEAAILTVQGTVTAPADATVSVNGVFAAVAAGHFTANVPILPGFARIAATLRRADGTSIQDSTTNVNTFPQAGPISLPAAGSIINGATTPVEGIAIGPEGSLISVNGTPMTVIQHGNGGSIGPVSYTSISHFRGEVPIVPGDNALTLTVTTPRGSVDRKTIHVTGSSSAALPTATITSPASGTKFGPGEPFYIATHAAASSTGRLTRVELLQDGAITQNLDVDAIATDTNFSIYTLLPPGHHQFVTKVTERSGNVGFSAPITIIVLSPPAISLTAPANNAQFTLGDPITVTASASDPDGIITRVDFIDHGVSLVRTLTTPPYSFSWTNAALGAHSLTARLSDNNSLVVTSAPIAVTVNPVTNRPPIVALTSPLTGQTFLVGAPISLAATASDPDGTIAHVHFFDGPTQLAAVVTPPYTYAWLSAAVGQHSLTATAVDNLGASAVSVPVTITVVQNLAPTVSLTSPTEGQSFFSGQPIDLTANAADADGTISQVEFLADGAVIGSAAAAPYGTTWTGAAVGSHTLTARATDNLHSQTVSAPVHVSVGANASPTLTLQAPRDNQAFSLGATIQLTATASDVDGSVARVEFYADNVLVASVAATPYIASWNGASAGLHHIYAKAIDDHGAVTTSAIITVPVIALAVSVASPAEAAMIAADFVYVSGSFSAPANSGATVNGLIAHVGTNGFFFVNNVPLAPGANTLTVVVTAPDGGSISITRTVNSTAVAAIQISADSDVGFAPTTFTILLENRTGYPIVDVRYLNLDGGSLDPTGVSQTMLGRLTYSVSGSHSPGFTVTDSTGRSYTQFLTLQVNDKAALDATLKTLWGDFTRALAAGNKAAAMGYLTPGAQDNYGPVFDALSGRLSASIAGWSAPKTGMLSDTVADLGVNRTIAGVNRIFLINMLRDQNGVWRIDGM